MKKERMIAESETEDLALQVFEVPRPKDRYDRDFEIPRDEFSQYSYGTDFSWGFKALREERRLVARVAELKAQGCEIRPGETLEEFVKRNIEEIR